MKGNITKWNGSKALTPIFIVLLIILIVVLCLRGCGADNKQSIDRSLPSLDFESDNGYTPQRSSVGIDIPATTGFIFTHGKTTQDTSFHNPDGNPCAFLITVYLSDGTVVYRSELIYPGESVDGIELSSVLQPGTYMNALLVYDCYELGDNPMPITRCELPIEITCN